MRQSRDETGSLPRRNNTCKISIPSSIPEVKTYKKVATCKPGRVLTRIPAVRTKAINSHYLKYLVNRTLPWEMELAYSKLNHGLSLIISKRMKQSVFTLNSHDKMRISLRSSIY